MTKKFEFDFKLSSLKDLKEAMILCSAYNRNINKTNLKKKIESINKFGLLSPIIVANSKCIENNDTMDYYDINNQKIDVSECDKDVYVILEGHHRYNAIEKINDDSKDYPILIISNKNDNKISLPMLINEINISSEKWQGNDYIKSISNVITDELICLINELSEKKYPISVISRILTKSKSGITPKKLNEIYSKESALIDLKDDSEEISECKNFINAVEKKFGIELQSDKPNEKGTCKKYKPAFHKKRYLYDALNGLKKINRMEFIKDVSEEDVVKIIKCGDDETTIKTIIKTYSKQ